MYCEQIPRSAAPSDATPGSRSGFRESATDGNAAGPSLNPVIGPAPQGAGSTQSGPVTRRQLGGLGRGLAGILEVESPPGKTASDGGGAGLDQLLGRHLSTKAASVRAFVVETALAAIAEAFGAHGVVMVSNERSRTTPSGHYRYRSATQGGPADDHEESASSPALALRLPPSWGPSSPALFAVYGNLWEMLTAEHHHCRRCGTSDQPLAYRQEKVDSHWAWFCRIEDQTVFVAAALVRLTPFDDAESDALARSMASVVTAVSPPVHIGDEPHDLKTKVASQVSLSADVSTADPENAITAEVTVQDSVRTQGTSLGLASVTATGRGPDIETAVARAAANACHPQCQVRFAGSSDVDGQTISVVIVSDHEGAPRLGVSIRPVGDHTGVAEAVFLAASTGSVPHQG